MGVGVGVIWSVVSGGGWICAVVGGGVRGVGVGVGWCRGCSLPGGSFGCVPRVFFLFRAGMPICSRDLAVITVLRCYSVTVLRCCNYLGKCDGGDCNNT